MATRADRNNNPTNIKVPQGGLLAAAQRYNDPNVSIDPTPASDGGQFLKFSSPEIGKQATSTLLKNPLYQNLTVDKAMKTWSGGGYGGEIAPDLANKIVSQLNPQEMDALTQNMTKREGGTNGTIGASGQNVGQGKMSVADFGKLIQAKHPEYAGKDATLVGQRTLEKYPQYQSKVQGFTPSAGSSNSGVRQSFPDALASVQPPQKQESMDNKPVGFVQGLVQDLAKYPLEAISSLRQLGNVGDQKEYNKVQDEGYDYGYFGKQRPMGQIKGGINSVSDFGKALSDPLAAGATVGLATTGLSGGLELLDKTLGSRVVSKLASNPVIKDNIVGGAKALADMSPKEVYNALKEVVRTGASKLTATDFNDVTNAIKRLEPYALREAKQAPSLLKKGLIGTAKLGLKGAKAVGKTLPYAAGYELLNGVEGLLGGAFGNKK